MQTRAGREKAKGAAQWKSFSAKAGAELREAGKGLKPGCLKLGNLCVNDSIKWPGFPKRLAGTHISH